MRYTCTLETAAARTARDWELQLHGLLNGLRSQITVTHRIRGRISTLEWLCNGKSVDPKQLELDLTSLQLFRQATTPLIKIRPNSCVPA